MSRHSELGPQGEGVQGFTTFSCDAVETGATKIMIKIKENLKLQKILTRHRITS